MAVNENLYSWMLKTYGMGAAEWYRSNPTKPSGANPFLPKGAYVPLAQKDAPGAKGPRGETLASVSPDIIEETIIEPAPKALVETEDQKFQRYYNQARQQLDIRDQPYSGSLQTFNSANPAEAEAYANLGELQKQYPNLATKIVNFNPTGANQTATYPEAGRALGQYGNFALVIDETPTYPGEYAAGGGLYYTPEFGEYGGYLTKENPDKAQVARALDMIARQRSGTADPSWANQDLSGLISQKGPGGWHVRGATASDPEVQKLGIYNVGRSDYRENRRNEAIAKNIEILQQQASSGNQNSQQFLDQYTSIQASEAADKQGVPEVGPRGEAVTPAFGPRGEDMGEIAAEYGAGFPKTPRWMKQIEAEYNKVKDKPYNPGTPKPGRGMGDTWEGPVREAQAPAFDSQKALIAAQAAGSYRQRGQVEDPFRSAAFG